MFRVLKFALNEGQGGTGGNTGGDGTPPPAFYEGFAPELKTYFATKGFKDVESLGKSYKELEGVIGAPKDRVVRIPEKDDAPEWSEVFQKLGRPAKPEEYGVKPPEGGSEEYAKWQQKVFHELGLSKKQGEALSAKWNERVAELVKKSKEDQESAINQQTDVLKKEWGQAFQQNAEIVDAFVKAAGISDEEYDKMELTLGVDVTNRLLYNIVRKFGIKLEEHGFKGMEGGTTGGFRLTPDQAQLRINALIRDKEFMQKFSNGDVKAREEWDKLHTQAFSHLDENA